MPFYSLPPRVCVCSLQGPACKYPCLLLIPDKKVNQIKPEAKRAPTQRILPRGLIPSLFLTGIILMFVRPDAPRSRLLSQFASLDRDKGGRGSHPRGCSFGSVHGRAWHRDFRTLGISEQRVQQNEDDTAHPMRPPASSSHALFSLDVQDSPWLV